MAKSYSETYQPKQRENGTTSLSEQKPQTCIKKASQINGKDVYNSLPCKSAPIASWQQAVDHPQGETEKGRPY